MKMIVTERHPIDGILADLGSLVRRVRAQTLDETGYRQITGRIRSEMADLNADPEGIIARRFDLLELAEEAGSLTPALFEEAAAAIRAALLNQRSQALITVPNFAVLPTGIHGHRIGGLTVIDGGRLQNTQPHTGA